MDASLFKSNLFISISVCIPLTSLSSTAAPFLTRLSGGGVNFGRLEISFDLGFSWNSVCDDFFSLAAAKIVCRQFRKDEDEDEDEEAVVVSGAAYGRGTNQGRRSYGRGSVDYESIGSRKHDRGNHGRAERFGLSSGRYKFGHPFEDSGRGPFYGRDSRDRRDPFYGRDRRDVLGVITDDFRDCKGTEKNIFECAKKRKRWKCDREEDVGVVCGGEN